jgi:hypothetical protein
MVHGWPLLSAALTACNCCGAVYATTSSERPAAFITSTLIRDIMISEIPWHLGGARRSRIHASKASLCASRTPSGARSSRRCTLITRSRVVGHPYLNGFVTSWSLTPVRSCVSRSRARRYAPPQAAPRTGSGGAWPRPCGAPLRGDGSRAVAELLNMQGVCPKVLNPPRNRVNPTFPPTRRPRGDPGTAARSSCGSSAPKSHIPRTRRTGPRPSAGWPAAAYSSARPAPLIVDDDPESVTD